MRALRTIRPLCLPSCSAVPCMSRTAATRCFSVTATKGRRTPLRSRASLMKLRPEYRKTKLWSPSKPDTPIPKPTPASEAQAPGSAEAGYSDEAIETTLFLPPSQRTIAPRPEKLDDASYEPATSGAGLPQVSTTRDWFKDDNHWDVHSRFRELFPTHAAQRVMHRAVIEVAVRRALVEALLVRQAQTTSTTTTSGSDTPSVKLTGSWAVGGHDQLNKVLALPIELKGGEAAVSVSDQAAAADILKALNEEDEHPEEDWTDDSDEPPPDYSLTSRPVVSSNEALELCKSWDKTWKDVPLDVELKFAISKRVFQLTGRRVSDHKSRTISTVGMLIEALTVKPKSKKLIEIIGEKHTLTSLPNVKIWENRIATIDKEQAVGRWKVIERELRKRDLPVTKNDSNMPPRTYMKDWFMGKA